MGTTIAGGCAVDALTYATLDTVKNDYSLDAVAAATPPYGNPFAGSWTIPPTLEVGDYAVMVEINKEFDSNPYHAHPNYDDSRFPGYGIDGNFGQPSVLFSVPIHIDVGAGTPAQAAVSHIAGYGDWDGATGDVNTPDGTISTAVPGSGEGRLLLTAGPGGTGRVHVGIASCVVGCSPPPAPPEPVTGLAPITDGLAAISATFSFANSQSAGDKVSAYQIRYQSGGVLTTDGFAQAISVQQVVPGDPGSPASFTIIGLRPAAQYVVGVRALDGCGQGSPLAAVAFQTPPAEFTQLSGCFIATAAYGSSEQPSVAALRLARDRLRRASALFATGADLYYRSGPAAAEVLKRSDTARALVRRLLGPLGISAQVWTQARGR